MSGSATGISWITWITARLRGAAGPVAMRAAAVLLGAGSVIWAALPPGALVVVFSPLLDQRFVEALRDMRERGFTLLVVDVLNAEPPARRRVPMRGGLGGSSSRASTDRIARRIWRMEQEAIRFSLRELGVPVVHWDGEESLDLQLAGYSRRPMAAWR